MNEINKYLSEEKVSEVIDAFEKMLDLRYTTKIPVFVTAAALAGIAIYECVEGAWLFGILLFVCLSPLVFAVGAFSIGSTLKRMINGINLIFRTTVNVSVSVYNDRIAQNKSSADIKNILLYSFRDVLMPVLSAVTRRILRGRIILKFVELVLKIGAKDIHKVIRREGNASSDNARARAALTSMETVDKISCRAVSAASALSKTVGILFALGGGLLTAILFTVRHFVGFPF